MTGPHPALYVIAAVLALPACAAATWAVLDFGRMVRDLYLNLRESR